MHVLSCKTKYCKKRKKPTVITQVLGNNYHGEIRESTNGTTLGQRVKRFTAGNRSINTQIKAPNAPKSKFEEVDPNFFNAAKK